MKLLYSIFDRVVGEYAPPFPCANHTHAVRMFEKGLADVQFPDDFRLYHVGYFDESKGFVFQDLTGDDNPHEIDTVEVFRQILEKKEGK